MSNGDFLLGIDGENLKRLCAGQAITVDLFSLGGHGTVHIVFGVTMDSLMKELEKTFGPLPPAQPLPNMPVKPQ